MTFTEYCAIAAVVVALGAAMAAVYAIRKRHVSVAKTAKPGGCDVPCDITRFLEYIEIYEKRYLANQIEEAAVRHGLGRDAVEALRAEFGKELLPPPYEAQGWLFEQGVAISDIVRMQAEWIRRNGGDSNVSPAAREVARIIRARCRESAEDLMLRKG